VRRRERNYGRSGTRQRPSSAARFKPRRGKDDAAGSGQRSVAVSEAEIVRSDESEVRSQGIEEPPELMRARTMTPDP
jgi:hypothetical protein